MKRWLKFFLVATVVLALVAGVPRLFLPPDPYSTLPVTFIGFIMAFSVAYWVVYRRPATEAGTT
jgi:hypothetical protein